MSTWYPISFLGLLVMTTYTWGVGAFLFLYREGFIVSTDRTFQIIPILMLGIASVLLVARLLRKQVFARKKIPSQAGFTLIELLVVISIIGILGAIMMTNIFSTKDKAYLARAKEEFHSINISLQLYYSDHLSYPADTNRNVPPGLEKYLANGIWPTAPWPGSVYDWDNWDINGIQTYQISIRFCPIGAHNISECHFPQESWAKNFKTNSAVYYCIQGSCRSHVDEPADYPGYCVNCNKN